MFSRKTSKHTAATSAANKPAYNDDRFIKLNSPHTHLLCVSGPLTFVSFHSREQHSHFAILPIFIPQRNRRRLHRDFVVAVVAVVSIAFAIDDAVVIVVVVVVHYDQCMFMGILHTLWPFLRCERSIIMFISHNLYIHMAFVRCSPIHAIFNGFCPH